MADGDQTSAQQTKKGTSRRPKGTTRLPTLAVRHGQVEKKHVEFDDLIRPIGKEKHKFMTFLGYKARNNVGIVWPTWKQVPQTTKDMIWEDIMVCNLFS